MLEQLVESKKFGNETKRIGGFLLSSFTAVVLAAAFALVYSLFSYNLALGSENLDISALVSPVKMLDEAPQPIAEKIQNQKSLEKTVSDVPVRQANIQRLEESPTKTPETVSVSQNQQQARPNSPFKIGRDDANLPSFGSNANGRSGDNQTVGLTTIDKSESVTVKQEIPPPPVIKQMLKTEVKREKIIATGGVVNGKATYLAKPAYSSAARAIHAAGQVKVQVLIDEDGNVISANVVSGHPLLRADALSAAKSSKFSPTTLSSQKVRVSGFIIYNFTD